MDSYLVERSSDIDRAVLDDLIHHFRDGLGKVRVGKLTGKEKEKKMSLKMSKIMMSHVILCFRANERSMQAYSNVKQDTMMRTMSNFVT